MIGLCPAGIIMSSVALPSVNWRGGRAAPEHVRSGPRGAANPRRPAGRQHRAMRANRIARMRARQRAS
jgi:hypothetical protein